MERFSDMNMTSGIWHFFTSGTKNAHCAICAFGQYAGFSQIRLHIQAKFHYLHLDITSLLILNIRFCHPNLVPLMGFCKELSVLVYEYMDGGSLYHQLHEVNMA